MSLDDIYASYDLNSSYQPVDRAEKAEIWLGDLDNSELLSTQYANKEVKMLSENVYFGAESMIDNIGKKIVMVWIADNEDRDTYNKDCFVYSIYNEEDNTWSEPVPIADDGTVDSYPDFKDGYIIRHLLDWKTELNLDDDIDLVHFNAGLWDDLIMVDGKHLTSIDVYKENIDRICTIIKFFFPKAKIVFATTTPVQEELFTGLHKRYNKDTELYNANAIEIVKKHGGEINDLYDLMSKAPVEYHSDLTHYYTKDGTRLITNKVIECIEASLEIKAEKLDYDALFETTDDATGL